MDEIDIQALDRIAEMLADAYKTEQWFNRQWQVGDRFRYMNAHSDWSFGTVFWVDGDSVWARLDDYPDEDIMFHRLSLWFIKED